MGGHTPRSTTVVPAESLETCRAVAGGTRAYPATDSTPLGVVGESREHPSRCKVSSDGTGIDTIHRCVDPGLGRALARQTRAGGLDGRRTASPHTWLELEAVRRAPLEFAVLVCDHSVLVWTDNSTDVSHIYHQGGTRALSLCILAWEMLRGCEDRGMAPVSAPLTGSTEHTGRRTIQGGSACNVPSLGHGTG